MNKSLILCLIIRALLSTILSLYCLLYGPITLAINDFNGDPPTIPSSNLTHSILPSSTSALKVGWENWYPYQYLKIKSLQSSLTGLDVELAKLFAKKAQQPLKFLPLSWDATLQALKNGEIDLATGATYSEDRSEYVYYSKPYRFEEDSLYIMKANKNKYKFHTVDEMIEYIQNSNFHLGVTKDYIYADDKINTFINDPKNAKWIVTAEDVSDNFQQLLDHEIDGFLSDRIVGSSIIWQAKKGKVISEHYLKMHKVPIHIMFSKASVPEHLVQDFNQAIDGLFNGSEYQNIFSWYLYPVIMVQTTGEHWFKLLDVLGAFFFSISGVLIAYTQKKHLLSAFIYAFLPSLSGAILRDVIVHHKPAEVLSTPEYMLLVCITTVVGYCLIHLHARYKDIAFFKRSPSFVIQFFSVLKTQIKQALIVCDAFGLSALSVSGVMIALMARADPLWLWGPFFAFISGAFGTIVRDLLSKEEELEIVVGEIYSEIAILWGLIFSVVLQMNVNNIQPDLVRNLIIITVVGAFATRLLIYFFKVPNVHFK